jgi:magnesium transporter
VMVREPVAVLVDTDREEVAELIQRYHLFGVPVVDHQRRLLGMVTSDSVIEAVQQEASEDFAVAVGAGSAETTRSPIIRSMKARLPWIGFDLAISSVVVIAVSRFEDILSAFTVLAALMPLVARVGGDAGAQSLAVVIRGLAAGDLAGSSVIRVVRREAAIGVLNGMAIGAASGLFAFVMQTVGGGARPLQISLVMALATLTNLTVAGVAGSGIPFLLRRLGLDPALGSNLLLTTVTDLIGFAGFLAVATALL